VKRTTFQEKIDLTKYDILYNIILCIVIIIIFPRFENNYTVVDIQGVVLKRICANQTRPVGRSFVRIRIYYIVYIVGYNIINYYLFFSPHDEQHHVHETLDDGQL